MIEREKALSVISSLEGAFDEHFPHSIKDLIGGPLSMPHKGLASKKDTVNNI